MRREAGCVEHVAEGAFAFVAGASERIIGFGDGVVGDDAQTRRVANARSDSAVNTVAGNEGRTQATVTLCLRSELVELSGGRGNQLGFFGRELAFADHVNELDAGQYDACCPERFEAQH